MRPGPKKSDRLTIRPAAVTPRHDSARIGRRSSNVPPSRWYFQYTSNRRASSGAASGGSERRGPEENIRANSPPEGASARGQAGSVGGGSNDSTSLSLGPFTVGRGTRRRAASTML